eukprot:TRINITY_DN2666_c0_g1_i1.p1 TRINITY_DN2666_c0_g1~~TRINITY_DN2666_c0_g1_i1.p1  ORF type:complete len:1192 (+),score=288.04 TRINITY_DN2666_c0_g1_i1:189-3578(+)
MEEEKQNVTKVEPHTELDGGGGGMKKVVESEAPTPDATEERSKAVRDAKAKKGESEHVSEPQPSTDATEDEQACSDETKTTAAEVPASEPLEGIQKEDEHAGHAEARQLETEHPQTSEKYSRMDGVEPQAQTALTGEGKAEKGEEFRAAATAKVEHIVAPAQGEAAHTSAEMRRDEVEAQKGESKIPQAGTACTEAKADAGVTTGRTEEEQQLTDEERQWRQQQEEMNLTWQLQEEAWRRQQQMYRRAQRELNGESEESESEESGVPQNTEEVHKTQGQRKIEQLPATDIPEPLPPPRQQSPPPSPQQQSRCETQIDLIAENEQIEQEEERLRQMLAALEARKNQLRLQAYANTKTAESPPPQTLAGVSTLREPNPPPHFKQEPCTGDCFALPAECASKVADQNCDQPMDDSEATQEDTRMSALLAVAAVPPSMVAEPAQARKGVKRPAINTSCSEPPRKRKKSGVDTEAATAVAHTVPDEAIEAATAVHARPPLKRARATLNDAASNDAVSDAAAADPDAGSPSVHAHQSLPSVPLADSSNSSPASAVTPAPPPESDVDRTLAYADELNRQWREAEAEVDGVISSLGRFFEENPLIRRRWDRFWLKQLCEIKAQCSQNSSDTIIAVVGESGAGKSTFINAIVEELLLPTNQSQACTAAVTDISYQDKSYEAKVEFFSMAEWREEYRRLLSNTARNNLPDSKAAKKILATVFGRVTPWAEQELPAELQKVLEEGSRVFQTDNCDELRRWASVYIDSSRATTGRGRWRLEANKVHYWPLVKNIFLRGPFRALRTGVHIIDLPGVNDSNPAREQITRNYIKQCTSIWVLAPIKRAATSKTVSALVNDCLSRHFRRDMLMDGHFSSMCVIATCADEINAGEVMRNLRVHVSDGEKPDEIQLAHMRNADARELIRQHLLEDVKQLKQDALTACGRGNGESSESQADVTTGDDPDELTEGCLSRRALADLYAHVQNIHIFTVSALDFLRILGKETISLRQLFTDRNDTEVPQLQTLLLVRGMSHRRQRLVSIDDALSRFLESLAGYCSVLKSEVDAATVEKVQHLFEEHIASLQLTVSRVDASLREKLASSRKTLPSGLVCRVPLKAHHPRSKHGDDASSGTPLAASASEEEDM